MTDFKPQNNDIDTGDEYMMRIEKLRQLREIGIQSYADKYDATITISDLKEYGDKNIKKLPHMDELEGKKKTKKEKIRGRIMLWREHGNLVFAQLRDETGQIQIALTKNALGENSFKNLKLIDAGDFIGVEGEIAVTKRGEPTVFVREYTLLSKTLRPMPEKYHGLKDVETRYQQRYLDILSNPEVKDILLTRANFIRAMREFYYKNGFLEVQTPVFQHAPSGALAQPFVTHHNALDRDFYLRIALEIHQKELIGAGFEKTFEIGQVFRNEGIDPSHLQEFMMCEHYAAYWNFRDNMTFTRELIQHVLKETKGNLVIPIKGHDGVVQDVDFGGKRWEEITFVDLIKNDCGIDINSYKTASDLRAEIKKRKIDIDDIDVLGRGNLIDSLYKKVSRPKMLGPVFLIKHPVDLSPLARKNDEDQNIVDRFQLVVNGWEVVNGYSELVDPIDQAERFNAQAKAKECGDKDAHCKDDEYVRAMEHGFPPISGVGIGIERFIALITGTENIKEVVWFPLVK